MRAVLVQPCLMDAFMRQFIYALLNPADAAAGIPQYVVFRTDKDDPSADPFDLDLFLFPDRMTAFRFMNVQRGHP